MCLAIPAKVLEVQEDVAKVDFGQGIVRDVNVMLVEAHVGEYVLVHAGYAIQVIDRKAAEWLDDVSGSCVTHRVRHVKPTIVSSDFECIEGGLD